MGDRDYYTISAGLVILISYFSFDLGQKTITLVIILAMIVRLLSIHNSNNKIDKQYNAIIQAMNEARATPGFQNSSLSYIFDTNFPMINARMKEKCIKKLIENRQIERDTNFTSDDYFFYGLAVKNSGDSVKGPYDDY